MQTIIFTFLLFVTVLYASSESCSKMKAIQRTSSSASGRWYLVASRKQDTRGKVFWLSKAPECGGSESPCLCIGFDINSTMTEPFISQYNMSFFYNTVSGDYTVQQYQMQLANEESEMELFNIKRKDEGETIVLSCLATDDYESFMLLQVCNDYNQDLDIWFLSKTKIASEESINNVNKALMANNLTVSQLSKVDQENCNQYPSITKTKPANRVIFF